MKNKKNKDSKSLSEYWTDILNFKLFFQVRDTNFLQEYALNGLNGMAGFEKKKREFIFI